MGLFYSRAGSNVKSISHALKLKDQTLLNKDRKKPHIRQMLPKLTDMFAAGPSSAPVDDDGGGEHSLSVFLDSRLLVTRLSDFREQHSWYTYSGEHKDG